MILLVMIFLSRVTIEIRRFRRTSTCNLDAWAERPWRQVSTKPQAIPAVSHNNDAGFLPFETDGNVLKRAGVAIVVKGVTGFPMLQVQIQ
jgi:hypothetical protein